VARCERNRRHIRQKVNAVLQRLLPSCVRFQLPDAAEP
jgi:hypothetical protein